MKTVTIHDYFKTYMININKYKITHVNDQTF